MRRAKDIIIEDAGFLRDLKRLYKLSFACILKLSVIFEPRRYTEKDVR